MVAAGKGRLSEVLTMLSNGADATMVSRDGSTAAQWGYKMGFPDVGQAIDTHLQVSPQCFCTSALNLGAVAKRSEHVKQCSAAFLCVMVPV